VEASGVAAPRLIEPMRDQHLNDGAMAHFWCKIYSTTPTSCEWFHNNRTLSSSDKYRIANNATDGDYALMVFNVRQPDAGVYKCVVSNPGGEVTCIAHLHIECTSYVITVITTTRSCRDPGTAVIHFWAPGGAYAAAVPAAV